ncbi:MAG: VCBS repeat-containing protein [Planctomycetota bacterium]
MNRRSTRPWMIVAVAGAVACLAAPTPAQNAKRITVTDEASPVPGLVSFEEFDAAQPPDTRKSSIGQLPGWPVTISWYQPFAPTRGLVLADLDRDGRLEVIASTTTSATRGAVYAWDVTAALMPGFPVTTIGMAQYAPSVGDLDGDGDLEIVQFTRGMTDGGRIYIFDHEGHTLPNFPLNINNNNIDSCPTLADLDDDGDLEILAGERAWPIGYLHVVEHDGTRWGGNWPVALDHVPTGTAAVADVNGDGSLEIFYLSYNSMYLLDTSGQTLPGWPAQIAGANFSYQSAAFADLDGDGDLEILVGAHKDAAGCHAYHHDATRVTGWPKLVGTWTYCPPTVADLEGDGELEVIFGRAGTFSGYSNCFWAWTATGGTKQGFPYGVSWGGGSEGPLTVADIDNDAKMEIFADHNVMIGGQGYLFGVDYQANDLTDFPLRPRGFTYMKGAMIDDVDGDGDYELAVVSADDLSHLDINLYALPGIYHPSRIEWATYHEKNARGGLYHGGERLHEQGLMQIGSPVTLYLHGDPGGAAYLWVALDTWKVRHPFFGWLRIDFTQRVPIFQNIPIPPGGEIAVTGTIPNDPALVDLDLYFQGLIVTDLAARDGAFTNMLGRTIQ